MKFSLKTYLIVVGVVGAVVGLLGNLLLNRPRMFLEVVNFAVMVGPFLAAIGTIIWLGVKAKRGRLVAWGAALLLAPFVLPSLLGLVLPSNPLSLMSTRQLIQKELPGDIEAPWVWNELASRVSGGSVTQGEANDALALFTRHMKTSKPAGWGMPLHWNRGFLNAAIGAGLLSDDALFEFCDAYYGPQAKAKPIPTLVVGQQLPALELEYGNPFSMDTPIQLVWNVRQVTLDGKPIQVRGSNRISNRWLGGANEKLSPGDHELAYELECAYIDAKLLKGMNVYGLPISKWPKGRKQWKASVKVPFKVQAAPSAASGETTE